MKKHFKLIVFILLAITIFIINKRIGFSALLSSKELIAELQSLVEENTLKAIMSYFLFTIVGGSILALPGFVFAGVGAIMFEPALATILCLFATTLNSGLTFLISRYFLKDYFKKYASKNHHLNKLLFEGNNKSYLATMLVTRLVPIFPYNLQNFAYGVTDISFKSYMIYTFIFLLPGTAAYTLGLGAFVGEKNRIIYLLIAILFVIMVIIVNKQIKNKHIVKG